MAQEDKRMKAKGTAEEVRGKAQAEWGDATDVLDEELAGRAREAKGKAQQTTGEAMDEVGDAADRIDRD